MESKHTRFLDATSNRITSPSPAVAAYLAFYRANLSDDGIAAPVLTQAESLWNRLTRDEQAALHAINNEANHGE